MSLQHCWWHRHIVCLIEVVEEPSSQNCLSGKIGHDWVSTTGYGGLALMVESSDPVANLRSEGLKAMPLTASLWAGAACSQDILAITNHMMLTNLETQGCQATGGQITSCIKSVFTSFAHQALAINTVQSLHAIRGFGFCDTIFSPSTTPNCAPEKKSHVRRTVIVLIMEEGILTETPGVLKPIRFACEHWMTKAQMINTIHGHM